MTPAARVQAAIGILDAWQGGADGLDRVLTRWGRASRYAGSGDRRAVADLAYDAVRRLRSAAWVAGAEEPADGRAVMRGSLTLDGAAPTAFFTGTGHAPAPLAPDEQGSARSLGDAPHPVRLDLPDWLAEQVSSLPDAVLEALRQRAPLDLRVNLLRANRHDAAARLAGEGIATEPVALSPTALRVSAGRHRIDRTAAWREGLVEVQDAASQAVADVAAARPGEVVLDLCAGGGGKTLAMAAAMQGQGRLLAHDISAARIAGLPERAARAGADVTVLASGGLDDLAGACDLVLVDAPCSGSGAWRRNPDAKWRLTPEGLADLNRLQSALLAQAAALARPTGHVVYVTCSLLACENSGIVGPFLAAHRAWRQSAARSLTPLDGGDGFFVTTLERTDSGFD